MACPCDNYIRLRVDLCQEELILTQVVADETSIWRARIEYNGLLKCEILIPVTFGKPVVLPNVLNEVYTHELRLYRFDDELIGCYWIGGPVLSQEVICDQIVSEDDDPLITEFGYKLITETSHA